MSRKRDIQVKFWVSGEEEAKLLSMVNKSGKSLSDYIRQCALGKKIIVIEEFKGFSGELKKIGVNLNQLSKAVNYGQIVDCSQELNELHEELKNVWQQLNDFLQSHR